MSTTLRSDWNESENRKKQPHKSIKVKQREKFLPYSDAKLSEVADVYWIYAMRKKESIQRQRPEVENAHIC